MVQPGPTQISTWQAAEANAAAWMRHWGFADARVTSAGADGGVDVRARAAVAQVKFEASQVGRPALQRLFGARGTRQDQWMLFFSGTGYAATALEYANQVGMALFVYRLDGQITAANGPARQLVAAAAQRTSAAEAGRPGGRTAAQASTPPDERRTSRTRASRPRRVSGVGAGLCALWCLFMSTSATDTSSPVWFRVLSAVIWLAAGAVYSRRVLAIRAVRGEGIERRHLKYSIVGSWAFAAMALAASFTGTKGAEAARSSFWLLLGLCVLLSLVALYRHGSKKSAESVGPAGSDPRELDQAQRPG